MPAAIRSLLRACCIAGDAALSPVPFRTLQLMDVQKGFHLFFFFLVKQSLFYLAFHRHVPGIPKIFSPQAIGSCSANLFCASLC